MCLGCHEPWVVRELDHLNNAAIRGNTGEHHAVFLEHVAVIVIDLVTVTVTFMNGLRAIKRIGLGLFIQDTRVGTKT